MIKNLMIILIIIAHSMKSMEHCHYILHWWIPLFLLTSFSFWYEHGQIGQKPSCLELGMSNGCIIAHYSITCSKQSEEYAYPLFALSQGNTAFDTLNYRKGCQNGKQSITVHQCMWLAVMGIAQSALHFWLINGQTSFRPLIVMANIRVCNYVGWHLPCKFFLQYRLLL